MEFDRELFRLKAELTINQCHLADVRDARAELDRQWTALQLARTALISQITDIEKPHE
jgi:hypothetical protein